MKIRKEFFSHLLFFSILWGIILVGTGTVTSGYHLMDDHEIITNSESIQNIGWLETLKFNISKDLEIRFRPFYWILRNSEEIILGDNLVLWHSYKYLQAVACSVFISISFFYFGLNLWLSILVSALGLWGYQTEIWWSLGPAEAYGMLSISISIFFLSIWYVKKRFSLIVLSTIFLSIAALTKESFLALLPATAVLFFLLFLKRKVYEELKFKIILALIIALFIGGIAAISQIGFNRIGYAGVDAGVVRVDVFLDIGKLLIREEFLGLIALGLMGLLIAKGSRSLWVSLLVLALAALPQYVIYLKSGFQGRYLVPLYFVYATYLGFLLIRFRKIGPRHQIIFSSILGLFVVLKLVLHVFPGARSYSQDGRVLAGLFTFANENRHPVTVVLDPVEEYEKGISLGIYLREKLGFDDVKYFLVTEKAKMDTHESSLYHSFIYNKSLSITHKIEDATLLISFQDLGKFNKDIAVKYSEPWFQGEYAGRIITYGMHNTGK